MIIFPYKEELKLNMYNNPIPKADINGMVPNSWVSDLTNCSALNTRSTISNLPVYIG